MRDSCFIDKTFDNASGNLYHLSIQISLDGFSFCILDIPKGKYIVLKTVNFFLKRPRLLFMHVRDLVNQDELLNLKFKSIDILYATSQFTIVPQSFYLNSLQEKYLCFNHEIEKGYSFEKTQLPRTEAWILYTIPENLKEFLIYKYPKANIRHNLFPLIETTIKSNKNLPENCQVHLNFFRSYFELTAVKGSKLLLCNQFNYSNDSDVLYYVLYLFEQFKLSQETTELILHGQLEQTDPIYLEFKKFVRKTSFAKLSTTYSYSYTFSPTPDHFFSSLFKIYKCE